MADIFYLEEMAFNGNWKPRTACYAPVTKTMCGIERTLNGLRRVRAVRKLVKGHERLSLSQLQQCYSPDGKFRHSN